jgi:hypothetical protein
MRISRTRRFAAAGLLTVAVGGAGIAFGASTAAADSTFSEQGALCGWQQTTAQDVHGSCSPAYDVTYRLSATCRAVGPAAGLPGYREHGAWNAGGNASEVHCRPGYEIAAKSFLMEWKLP